jgi:Protein of unknown function (DUF3307)
MTETFAVLLLAHALADFVFQSNWMVANKRRPFPLLAHTLVVLATAIAATGSLHPALFALAAAHLAIDAAKAWSPWKGLKPFLADQALHIATLAVTATYAPDLWATGLWAAPPDTGLIGSLMTAATPSLLPPLMTLASGLILATRAGGFAIGFLMKPWAEASPEGLPGGGRVIGMLERGLIYLLVIAGQAEGIGFLIAAKSVLRFGTVGDDRKVSEYVIIGTLASFGWAMAVSFITAILLQHLSPLGIPDLTP